MQTLKQKINAQLIRIKSLIFKYQFFKFFLINSNVKYNLLQTMFPARNPSKYIKFSESLYDQKCSMCFNINLQVFRCAGPCQKIICIDCVDRFASNRYPCSYCEDIFAFSWNSLEPRNIEFECPYDSNHATLTFLEEFTQHCWECPLMKQQNTIIRDRVMDYQCNEGHGLIFLSQSAARKVFAGRSFFNALTHSKCIACTEVGLCRSYCPDCTTDPKDPILYCVKCRFPPATKAQCPLGHELRRKNYKSVTSICDFCGYSDRFSRQFAYSDSECNFDVCYRCHFKLQNENKLQPLKNQFEIRLPIQETPLNIQRFQHIYQDSDSDEVDL